MIISWNTTNACNMYCDHCYRDAGCQAEEELNTAQAKTLLEQIAKAGFKIMIFSGGEPLMRPDIVEPIYVVCQLDFQLLQTTEISSFDKFGFAGAKISL